MSFLKYLLPLGATAMLAVVLAQGSSSLPSLENPFTVDSVSAQEVLSNAIEEFHSLTDAQIQALNERLGAPCEDVLTEARDASDLTFADIIKTVNGSEVTYSFGNDEGGFSMTSEDGTDELEDLTFLQYTRTDGTVVRLGVDPQDAYMPAFVAINGPVMVDGEEADSMVIMRAGDAASEGSDASQEVQEEESQPSNLNYMGKDANGCEVWQSDDGKMGGGSC